MILTNKDWGVLCKGKKLNGLYAAITNDKKIKFFDTSHYEVAGSFYKPLCYHYPGISHYPGVKCNCCWKMRLIDNVDKLKTKYEINWENVNLENLFYWEDNKIRVKRAAYSLLDKSIIDILKKLKKMKAFL